MSTIETNTHTSTPTERGVWSEEEHAKFLAGLKLFPNGPWKDIAAHIGTRSSRQVQAHAQKYYEKVGRRMRGLRKTRTQLLRPEHRLGDDMKALCDTTELAETGVRIGQIRRGLKAIAVRDANSSGDGSSESEANWTTAPAETTSATSVVDSSLDWIDVLFQDEELASWIPTTTEENTETDSLDSFDDHYLSYLIEILDSAELEVSNS